MAILFPVELWLSSVTIHELSTKTLKDMEAMLLHHGTLAFWRSFRKATCQPVLLWFSSLRMTSLVDWGKGMICEVGKIVLICLPCDVTLGPSEAVNSVRDK